MNEKDTLEDSLIRENGMKKSTKNEIKREIK